MFDATPKFNGNDATPDYMKEEIKCPFCGKKKQTRVEICPCEIAPKYDPDYEEWRNN